MVARVDEDKEEEKRKSIKRRRLDVEEEGKYKQ